MNYFLSLGSNLGHRKKNLQQAARLLITQAIKIVKSSSLYVTEPVDYHSQPWFLNCVLQIETELSPEELLSLTQHIEDQLGRQRDLIKGPRTIDIDILLAENLIFHTSDLIIPHPRLAERNFVLVPMAEIAPEVIHPVYAKKIITLFHESRDKAKVVRLSSFVF